MAVYVSMCAIHFITTKQWRVQLTVCTVCTYTQGSTAIWCDASETCHTLADL